MRYGMFSTLASQLWLAKGSFAMGVACGLLAFASASVAIGTGAASASSGNEEEKRAMLLTSAVCGVAAIAFTCLSLGYSYQVGRDFMYIINLQDHARMLADIANRTVPAGCEAVYSLAM